MTKYARLRGGSLIDVKNVPGDFAHLGTLNRCLPGGGFIDVPGDAQNGAKDNGDGTYTNPTPTAPALAPKVFDTASWKEYAYGVLGTIAAPLGTDDEKLTAGLRRYGAILKAARASIDDGTVAALDQYDDADNYRKDRVALFLKVLNDDNKIVTDTEFAAIIGSWPEA